MEERRRVDFLDNLGTVQNKFRVALGSAGKTGSDCDSDVHLTQIVRKRVGGRGGL